MAEHIIRHRIVDRWHTVSWNDDTGEVWGNSTYAMQLRAIIADAPP